MNLLKRKFDLNGSIQSFWMTSGLTAVQPVVLSAKAGVI
jgi:hypothetical protein